MKIALLGDTAFFGKYSLENKQVFEYFEDVKNFLSTFDHVIANLETPFVKNWKKKGGNKSAYIGSRPENLELLKYIGINCVNLANNHIFDYGKEAYELTIKLLNEAGIFHFGTEENEVVLKSGNTQVALNGYCCYSTNPTGLGPKGINPLNVKVILKMIVENQNLGLNNILSIHAGQEHVNFPNYDHMLLARMLADKTPYVYYGHHPHVLQGVEEDNNSLIAYSLGNFCFDDVYSNLSKEPLIKQNENNKSSMILSLEYTNNSLSDYKVIPLFAGEEKMEIGNTLIKEKIQKYSEKLSIPADDYIEMRTSLFRSYIESRKNLRNFGWYLKRLNLKSVKMILAARRNKQRYYENLKRHLPNYTPQKHDK